MQHSIEQLCWSETLVSVCHSHQTFVQFLVETFYYNQFCTILYSIELLVGDISLCLSQSHDQTNTVCYCALSAFKSFSSIILHTGA